ncbi:TIR domain-containing protein [Methanobacterium oryzae]|uniref:TIR domain-containing protein n=1 Tax=Methanobacterium oryzae TaxID=69540 RepID=UPI003D235646
MFESELEVYKIFISHIGENEDEYSIFIEKLQTAHEFEFKNLGILDRIAEKDLQKQINSVGVVIILSGLYNKYKSIIKKQVDIAKELDKPIIVIRPFGMENVPFELEKIATDIVGWNAPCIVHSIEENYITE